MEDDKIVIYVDCSKFPNEFLEVVQRAYKEKPDKKDLNELRKILDENPTLWRGVFDLAEMIQSNLISRIVTPKPAQMALEGNIAEIKQGLGYSNSSIFE